MYEYYDICPYGGRPMGKFNVKIEFCRMWNYSPKAASLAEQLFSHFRHEVESLELIPSKGGVFEVTVNNEKVYSKEETGLFPKTEDILEKMQA